MNKQFEIMEIDDVFTSISLEVPYEFMVTAFYVNSKNNDCEWNFFINLN